MEGGCGEECVETKIGFCESSVPSTKIENETKRSKNCVAQTGLTSSSASGFTDSHTEMLAVRKVVLWPFFSGTVRIMYASRNRISTMQYESQGRSKLDNSKYYPNAFVLSTGHLTPGYSGYSVRALEVLDAS